MKYKVGDKVRVRKDLVRGNWYGKNDVAPEMLKYCGKEVVIAKVCDGYGYQIDGLWCGWTDEMFEVTPSTLTTAEMIAALAQNPEQRYKNERMGGTVGLLNGDLVWLDVERYKKHFTIAYSPDNKTPSPTGGFCTGNLLDHWTLLPPEPKPVPFMEAVNSGKWFKPETWWPGMTPCASDDDVYRDLYDNLMMFEGREMLDRAIINGKWFIKED